MSLGLPLLNRYCCVPIRLAHILPSRSLRIAQLVNLKSGFCSSAQVLVYSVDLNPHARLFNSLLTTGRLFCPQVLSRLFKCNTATSKRTLSLTMATPHQSLPSDAGGQTVKDLQTETSPKQTATDQSHAGASSTICDDGIRLTTDDDSVSQEAKAVPQLSKRAQKKMLRREKLKELRKAKRESQFTKNSSPGFSSDIFSETDYYFENGLRKVYPYPYTFSTYAKERWYGRTIQDIFENEFRVDSPDNFRTSVAKGNMRVNGDVIGLDHVLKNGDLIEHHIHRHENPVSGTPIEIIADTPELVVINKPASIPCHPCGKFRFNSIVFIMGKEFGYSNLRNIYRLDRLTSGVLIMGKTARKTKELENQVLHRRVHKEYVARVVGEFPEEEVVVDQPLDCLSHKLTLWQVQAGGKPSRTTFQRLSYNGQTSVVRCIPHTGRTHQIRVHLQYLGHPIVNDPYYNSPSWGPLRGKGGHCDVSHEELCQRIMQEHNVGMWCEGENPLFRDRLATTEQPKPGPPLQDNEPRQKDILDSVDLPDCAVNKEKQESCDSESPGHGSAPKRPRLSTEGGAPTLSKAETTTTDFPLSAHSSAVDLPACGNEPNGETKPGQDSCVIAGASSALTEVKEASSNGETGASQAELKEDTQRLVQKGFEAERWKPDPLCESCRLKYIDPRPCDLLLYLHAFKYKGPTWEYSTRLPDWAAEDWEEPEEYRKYL